MSTLLTTLLSANAQWAERLSDTHPNFFSQCAKGQSPKVLWIGCADSRVPESVVTDAKPGDIFVHRNIANQFHPDDDSALSVLMFAVNAVGVEHVLVVGHTHCGGAATCLEAVQAQASNSPPPVSPNTPLGRWLAPLTNLVSTLDLDTLPAETHLDAIVEANVKRQVENVCATDVIKGAWAAALGDESGEKRQVWVHGWVYDVASGRLKDLGVSRGPQTHGDISNLEFYRASQRVAHAVRPGRQSQDKEVAGIVANVDSVLYHALFLGIANAGLIPLPMSPRNSRVAILNLLKTKVKKELAPHGEKAYDLQIDEPPTLAAVYPYMSEETINSPFVPYLKAKQKEQLGLVGAKTEVGNHELTKYNNVPGQVERLARLACERVASLQSVSMFTSTAYQDPTRRLIPNAQNALVNTIITKSGGFVVVPAFLEEWASMPEFVKQLSGLLYVSYPGSPLSKKAGDALVDAGDQKEWEWVRRGLNKRIRREPVGDETLECQMLSSDAHQASVENLPDVKGYVTSDVFTKHPTIEGLYKVVGKLGDVLVLSSREETVPAPMESVFGTSRQVSDVFGVLVEPRLEYAINVEDEKQVAEFGNLIWHVALPHLRNHAAPSVNLCRIFREKILVTSRDRPVLRTGKGTVTKKVTLSLYKSEIDVLGIVNSDEFVDPDVDLFEQGFDSLSATFLGNRINGSLKVSPDQNVREAVSRISRNIVFAYPTLRLLAGQLVNIVARKAGIVDAKAEIEHMLERYSSGLPGKPIDGIPTRRDRNEPHVVLVTGSTGALGSYMVSSLLKREDVAQICVLNRRSKTTTSQERQLSTFQDRGLNTVPLESQKLVYVDGDTSREDLGLEGETYAGVTIQSGFMSSAMLEPNVRGTRNLIDLAPASKKTTKPRFMFTSSITSAQNWDKKRGRVPEDVIADVTVAVGSGYGASKYVSERMLGMSGLPATSFRIGQITGATPRGAWPVTELVPMAVKSSVMLGALPDLGRVLQSVAWLPVDAVSGAILDVASSDDEPPTMANLVHPRPVEFEALMKPISDALFGNNITKERLPLVHSSEWFHRLEKEAIDANEEKARRVPAIKLLDYLRMFDRRSSGEDNNVMAIMFSTDTAERVSKTMQVLPPISRLDAMRWVEYWVSVGWFQNVVGMSRDAMQPSVLKMGGNVVKDVKAKL
ncbi:hypothetical protein EDD16DRAFT_1520243 [Pisolithus croceorrhizus]|nr:hypothetical protein EDD16DRAFT_1520243 [Pisolithus croceorrhizus]